MVIQSKELGALWEDQTSLNKQILDLFDDNLKETAFHNVVHQLE